MTWNGSTRWRALPPSGRKRRSPPSSPTTLSTCPRGPCCSTVSRSRTGLPSMRTNTCSPPPKPATPSITWNAGSPSSATPMCRAVSSGTMAASKPSSTDQCRTPRRAVAPDHIYEASSLLARHLAQELRCVLLKFGIIFDLHETDASPIEQEIRDRLRDVLLPDQMVESCSCFAKEILEKPV